MILMYFFSWPYHWLINEYFSSSDYFLEYLNPSPPVLIFKNISYWYYPVVGFSKINYRIWIQQLFKCFTSWNTRYIINRICIILFTCNLYISFLSSVGVSTCSLQLLLSISITQPFKQIIDSIQGPMLFLIWSAQLNYLSSKTFRLTLQSMTIWKIGSPDIFQVFREENRICSVTCLA